MTFEEQKRIAAQFPKPHRCSRSERFISKLEWDGMQFRYEHTDSFATYEARDCPLCLSTLVVIKTIHDSSKE